MKKILLLLTIALSVTACGNYDQLDNNLDQTAPRAFYRKVNMSLDIVNSLQQSAFIYWGINSVEFIDGNTVSGIYSTDAAVNFSGSTQTVYPNNLTASFTPITDYYLEVESEDIGRIDINFGYLSQSPVETYIFEITARLTDDNGNVLLSTTELSREISSPYIISMDLNGIPDRSNYNISVSIEALESEPIYIKNLTSEMYIHNDIFGENVSVSWDIEYISFLGANDEIIAFIDKNEIVESTGTAEPSYIPLLYLGNLVFAKETFTAIEIKFNKIVNENFPYNSSFELGLIYESNVSTAIRQNFYIPGYTTDNVFRLDVSSKPTDTSPIYFSVSLISLPDPL